MFLFTLVMWGSVVPPEPHVLVAVTWSQQGVRVASYRVDESFPIG